MMKVDAKASLVFVALLLVAPGTGHSSVITIDFDDLPSGTILGNQYATKGVSFSAYENGVTAASVVTDLTGGFTPPNAWSNCGNRACVPESGETYGINRRDVLRMDFDNPVSGLSWYTDTIGIAPLRFDAYDLAGNLLETVRPTFTTQGVFAFATFSVSGIARVAAFQPSDDWAYQIDNLSFQVDAPGTLSLLALALACVAGRFGSQRDRIRHAG